MMLNIDNGRTTATTPCCVRGRDGQHAQGNRPSERLQPSRLPLRGPQSTRDGFDGDSVCDLRFGEWSNVVSPRLPYTGLRSVGNGSPSASGSNGRRTWVADIQDDTIYGYSSSDLSATEE